MGLNAFFTYTICFGMGYTWQQGLAIVFISGLIFLAVTVSPLRSKIIASIPALAEGGHQRRHRPVHLPDRPAERRASSPPGNNLLDLSSITIRPRRCWR